ncbi:MAG TPA: AAA family ATPase [Micromonosporaceae bacterium]
MPETGSLLVGRDDALATLRSALRTTVDGAGGCLIVEGPAGIGKSRMLAAGIVEAHKLDMMVASGQATELDRVAPLSSLMTSLRQNSPPGFEISRLGSQDGNRLWLVHHLGEMIADYVRARALLIVLDDAHWADELTALALRVLVPALSSSPVLWLLARRRVPTRSSAQDAIDWLAGEGARRLELGPLGEAAVAELCANVLEARPDSTVLALANRCGGNPFLLEQLLTTLRDAGQLLISDGVATVVAGDLPSGFLAAVNQRLRDLSLDGRRLLEAGSVLGRPFTVHEAAGLMGRSAVEVVPIANEAVAAGTLVDNGREFAFRHDLIREAVYNNLSGPVRSALHREAAEVARAEDRSPVEIAEHLLRGGHKRDDDVVGILRDAAAQVAPNAPGTAADIILRILDLVGEEDEARPRLISEAVRLLASAGRLVEARELGEAALHTGLDPAAETVLLLGLSEALKHSGYNTAVVEYTRRALARPGIPEASRAHLLAIQAHGLLYVGDIDAADHAGQEAAAIGETSGEHAATVFGMVARSVAARAKGRIGQAITHAREAVRIAEYNGGEARQRHPRLWLARGLVAADRFTEADAVYATGQREADQLGTAWSQPLWHYYRAELRMAAGRLDDAQAEAEAGVRTAEQLTALQLSVPLLALLARVAVRRDQVPMAREYLRRTQRLVADGISVAPGQLTWAAALVHDAMEQPRAAVDALEDVYKGLPDQLLLLTEEPQASATLVRLAQRVEDREKAEAAVAGAQQLAELNPDIASLKGAAAHAEGLLRGDRKTLHTAVEHYRASPRPLALAAALQDAAAAEYAAGNRDRAMALWDQALDHYVNSGAKRDVGQVQRVLRRAGVRRRARRDRRDLGGPVAGWGSLTESELRVVQLVAEGLTNREVADRLFLSPHTVDSHLRHAFTKLGVNSRVELTRRFMAYENGEDHVKT